MSYPPRQPPRIQTHLRDTSPLTSTSNNHAHGQAASPYPFSPSYQPRSSTYSQTPSTTIVDYPTSAHPLFSRSSPGSGAIPSSPLSSSLPAPGRPYQYLSIYKPEYPSLPYKPLYDRPLPTTPPSALSLLISKMSQHPLTIRLREWFTTIRILNILFAFLSLCTVVSGVTMTSIALMWLYPYTISPLLPKPGVEHTTNISFEGFDLSQTVSFLSIVLPPGQMITSLVLGVLLIVIFFLCIPSIASKRGQRSNDPQLPSLILNPSLNRRIFNNLVPFPPPASSILVRLEPEQRS